MIIPVQNLQANALKPYFQLSERELLHFYEPNPGLFVAESPLVIQRALRAGYEALSFLMEESELTGENTIPLLSDDTIPVYTASKEIMSHITGYPMTRGALALLRRRPLPDPYSLCKDARRIVVLEDVVNPTNLGSIFRSAAALSADAILLTGGCTDPLYRRAARVSMGTVFQIPWAFLPDANWIQALHDLEYQVTAMALRNNTMDLDDPSFAQIPRLAIVMGSEGPGLREETIRQCKFTVKIPMAHGVDSLNVAAAGAIALWQLCRIPASKNAPDSTPKTGADPE